ncbi:MAG TPA: UDP-2,3-diacylglucosamine diphosphatase [candidate division Zixibacteria bacterium]|nr:UDP-2,3-diacylglucosamine diphosphatase [candidate division Zixibacteria bacterium]
MSVLFISDIHLGERFPEREKIKKEKLSAFLEMAAGSASRLFVVGDLFDFWFEYKHAVPKGHLNIILKLSQLHENGTELSYITGNHDFWLGDFLASEVGFKIYRDQLDIELDGKRVHIIHGDGLAKKDRGYRVLKKVLRNRLNIFLYRLLSPDLGIPFAKFVSGRSRGHTQKRPKEIFLEEYRQYARKKLDAGYDAVIMAHTHVPEEISFDNGIYLNTGDWIENFTYVEFSEGRFKLKKWD